MEAMSLFLCYTALCTTGAVATTAGAVEPVGARKEALTRMSCATVVIERPADPALRHDSFVNVKPKPEHQRPTSYIEEPQQVQADVGTNTQLIRTPTESTYERTTLQLQQPRCQMHQRRNAPTSWQQSSSLIVQQPSLQQREPDSKERWEHQGFKKRQELVDSIKVEHQTKRPLERQPPRHKLTQDQKAQKPTRLLKRLGLQQERKHHEEQRHQAQRESLEQHSAGEQQQRVLHPKLEGQSSWKREQEEETDARAQQPRFRARQQQQQTFLELHPLQPMSYQRSQQDFRTSRQLRNLQKPEQQRESSLPSQHQSHASSATNMPRETRDLTDRRRALQHVVQQQVLDFDAPMKPQGDHRERRQKREPGGQHVHFPGSTQDTPTHVRGQEQKVLWGARNPNVQLPQQVNLSQVLIQNSSQLFFNYDQPQQRGTGNKKREDGGTDAGEYNWQQHVRGQPGRSDGEQQQRKQQEQQEQLLRQQQLLLEGLFALGRKVDKGQRQLKTYQDIHQQLQMLHMLQLHLIQQLTLVKQQGNQRMQHQQPNQQQQGSNQQHLQRQNVSLAYFDAPLYHTCAVENYPLIESFLQWNRVQKENSRLLAMNSDLAAAARAAEAPATFSSSMSEANLLSVKYDALSLHLDGSEGPDIGTFSLGTFTGGLTRTKDTEFASKQLPPARRENLTEASLGKKAQVEEINDKKPRLQQQNIAHQDTQKLQSAQGLQQSQQKAEQPLLQQTVKHVLRETEGKRKVSEKKQVDAGGSEKLCEQGSAAHKARGPLSPADVRRALLPLFHGSLEQSATGAMLPTAAAKGAKLLVSQLSQESAAFPDSSNHPEYTKQRERRQQEKGHYADVQSGPTIQVAEAGGRCQAKAEIFGPKDRAGRSAPAGAADIECQTKRNIGTAGSVNKDETAGTRQRKREQLELQQRPNTQVQSLTEIPSVMALSRKTSGSKLKDDKREHAAVTQDDAINVDAHRFPDHQPGVKRKQSRGARMSEKNATNQRVVEVAINLGRDERDVDTNRITPAAMSTVLTERLDNGNQNELTSTAYEKHEHFQERMQRHPNAADSTVSSDERHDGSPQIKVGADNALEEVTKQDPDGRRQNSHRKQRTSTRAAQRLERNNELHRLETLGRNMRQLQNQRQKYEEELVVLIGRITQQQEVLEQKKRSLQQQRENLYELFSIFEPEKGQEQQEARVNTDELVQNKESKGQHLERLMDREVAILLQQHFRRPLAGRSRRSGGKIPSHRMEAYVETAGDAGTSYALSGTSSSRALQIFNRSIFDVPPMHGIISLCKTLGQPCAAGTLCCEDLQCFTPVNNSYTVPSLDGRGTCQPGSTPAVPTSAFRLPIQVDPVTPQRDESRTRTTMQDSVFNNVRGTLEGGKGGESSGRNAAASGLPDATATGVAQETELARVPAPTSVEGLLGDENLVDGNTGGARRRAGFASQYSLPSNSRGLTEKDAENDRKII